MSGGEYWDAETRTWRQAGSGRTEAEQRAFERGYEQAGDRFTSWAAKSHPAAGAPEPAYLSLQAPRVLSTGDRGTWLRSTMSGKLRSVTEPDDPDEGARELRSAKEFIDQFEYTYGRRPSVTEARSVVGRRSDGALLSGTVEEVARAFRLTGLRCGIVTEVAPLPPPEAAVAQPVRRG